MKYMTLQGRECGKRDPERGVWYSTLCGYWTDDWEKLGSSRSGGLLTIKAPNGEVAKVTAPGFPVCPRCGAPGMQATYGEWIEAAEKYESEGHPGYVEGLVSGRETCDERRDAI